MHLCIPVILEQNHITEGDPVVIFLAENPKMQAFSAERINPFPTQAYRKQQFTLRQSNIPSFLTLAEGGYLVFSP